MRVFFCVELDSSLKSQIYRDFTHLRKSSVKVGWVKPENLHITIKFLGEIEESQIDELQGVSERILANASITSELRLTLNQAGAFPTFEKPRVIWIGSSQNVEELSYLAKNLNEQLAELGFEREKKTFTPHVTLGRVKDHPKLTGELTELIKRTPPFAYSAKIDKLTLMESRLAPDGSIYKPIFHVPFES